MKRASRIFMTVGLLAGLSAANGAAAASPQAVYCAAVRTVPKLDQNGYTMGVEGYIFETPSFSTDLPADQLKAMWRRFVAGYAAASGSNPGDSCYGANARSSLRRRAGDGVKSISVDWSPTAPKPAGN